MFYCPPLNTVFFYILKREKGFQKLSSIIQTMKKISININDDTFECASLGVKYTGVIDYTLQTLWEDRVDIV